MDVDKMDATMVKNLEEKTGKNLDEWKKIARESGIEKHREMIKFLQSEHGMTYGYANLVTRYARAPDGICRGVQALERPATYWYGT